jgi:hypothetical protein
MSTDDLERRMNELCHRWRQGKDATDGTLGPVQAAARVLAFQALAAWTILEASGQASDVAPDLETWLARILASELPHVRANAKITIKVPKH